MTPNQISGKKQVWAGPNGGKAAVGAAKGPNRAAAGFAVKGPGGNAVTGGAVYNRLTDTLTIGGAARINGEVHRRSREIPLHSR